MHPLLAAGRQGMGGQTCAGAVACTACDTVPVQKVLFTSYWLQADAATQLHRRDPTHGHCCLARRDLSMMQREWFRMVEQGGGCAACPRSLWRPIPAAWTKGDPTRFHLPWSGQYYATPSCRSPLGGCMHSHMWGPAGHPMPVTSAHTLGAGWPSRSSGGHCQGNERSIPVSVTKNTSYFLLACTAMPCTAM